MPTVQLTNTLRQEYETLFNTCAIRPERPDAENTVVDKLQANRNRYAGGDLGI